MSKPKFSGLCGFVVLLVTPLSSIADVKSMSLERFKNTDTERYWEVAVNCSDGSDEKLMKRVVGGGDEWCAVDNPQNCDSSKFALSRAMCGDEQQAQESSSSTDQSAGSSISQASETSESESTPATSRTVAATATADEERKKNELLREQMQIEEQRIQIEQKRLELLESEIELKKKLEQN